MLIFSFLSSGKFKIERRLNFENMMHVSYLFRKAKQPNDQTGKILCPRFIKTVKRIYWPYPAFRWNRIMTGATVSIQMLPSVWVSLLINT